jgi:Rho guanine nucleotide exchange factor 7
MQQISQHKRSLSFNHHLSYNQVLAQQQLQQMHQPPQPPAFMKQNSTPQHQLLSQRKEIVPTSPSIKSTQAKSKTTSLDCSQLDAHDFVFTF